ncbi:hypothetical protein DY000_02020933 [Brassica cretica]|uniref:Uncharacterized protein n=1 Tax=Brassica cretica TaxID=69181 RepID=A0ABQ7E1X9_BRACR|nr:hypothetical protein DY000_02020933 [Brassica cretica]
MAPLTDSFEPEQQKKRHSYRISTTRRLRANVATLLEQRRSTSLPFSDQTIDDSLRSPERNSTHIARESSVNTRPPYEPRCASRERDSGVLLSGRRRRASHTPRQLLSSPHPPLRCRSETMAGKVRPASKFATKVRTLKADPTSDHLFTRLTAAPDPPSICPDLVPPRSEQPLATVKLTRDSKYVAEGWNGTRKAKGKGEGELKELPPTPLVSRTPGEEPPRLANEVSVHNGVEEDDDDDDDDEYRPYELDAFPNHIDSQMSLWLSSKPSCGTNAKSTFSHRAPEAQIKIQGMRRAVLFSPPPLPWPSNQGGTALKWFTTAFAFAVAVAVAFSPTSCCSASVWNDGAKDCAMLIIICVLPWERATARTLEMKTPADKDKLGLVFLPSESPVTSLIQ